MGLAPDKVGEYRTCHSCHDKLSIEEFQEYKPGKRRRSCRDCRNLDGRIRAEKRRESAKYDERLAYAQKHNRAKSVISRVTSEFGVTAEELEDMTLEQNNTCAICGKPESRMRNGVPLRLCIDHNHRTGVVRGLLCSRCNVAIGMMDDDPDLFLAAAQYILKHSQEEGD